ncbi:uncharacterized protein LOC132296223 [Cornus florida]|uniref:uncharacterized protein LOC132296223 n=1 Tax=Cornus florida TaxID=4283 RepID=UPI002898CB85|nr:uncharacterized protein LOC132296223 [Cornus florida]
MTFEFLPPSPSTPNLIVPRKEVVEEIIKFWSSSHLVGVSIHKRIPFKVIQTAAAKLWGSYGLTYTILGEGNTYYFRFKSTTQANNVLLLGPWSIAGLSYITSSVREPLYADLATEGRIKLKFSRVCVNLDLTKPLKSEVELKMEDGSIEQIRIEYQWLLKFCSKCNLLNHTEVHCPLQYVKLPQQKNKGITYPTDNSSIPQKDRCNQHNPTDVQCPP